MLADNGPPIAGDFNPSESTLETSDQVIRYMSSQNASVYVSPPKGPKVERA